MSNTLEIQGTIKLIKDTQTFDSGFEKREFVITCGDKYPQDIKMEVYKQKCAELDNLQIGQQVNVGFNIRGNEYNGNFYVNLQAWRIDAMQNAQQNTPEQTAAMPDQVQIDSVADPDDITF